MGGSYTNRKLLFYVAKLSSKMQNLNLISLILTNLQPPAWTPVQLARIVVKYHLLMAQGSDIISENLRDSLINRVEL